MHCRTTTGNYPTKCLIDWCGELPILSEVSFMVLLHVTPHTDAQPGELREPAE